MGKRDRMSDEEIVSVFWDFLKKDPEHKDRRQTAWGTKTKQGLAATIKRLGKATLSNSDIDSQQEAGEAPFNDRKLGNFDGIKQAD